MRVLVLNAGSSTLKASFVTDGVITQSVTIDWPASDAAADRVVDRALHDLAVALPNVVGYRVVHGGAKYREPASVDDDLLAAVEELDALAPLHNRRAAAVMRAGRSAIPDARHVACFDSAFHASLPEEGWRYALPSEWVDRWSIRRFGFHGLSVAWAVERAGVLLARPVAALRVVVAHLGSGSSATAVDGGRSVATTMGYTPLEGMVMGTRSGSIDPGILIRLVSDGVAIDDLRDGLDHRSGLQGLAGTSDVRKLEVRARAGDSTAMLALRVFGRQAAAAIAAAATALGGLDGVVFTGGIGEGSESVRDDVIRRLGVIGLEPVNGDRGDGDRVISVGPPAALVVAAREDLVIAREVEALVR